MEATETNDLLSNLAEDIELDTDSMPDILKTPPLSFVLETAPEAFGSGDHPSTHGVLRIMQAIENTDIGQVLDVGCGSGILAIAAAMLWNSRVLAVDCKQDAVEMTLRNAEKNSVHNRIEALRSMGFNHPRIAERGPYDLIVENILAEQIVEMAIENVKHLKKSGLLILSGILAWQEEGVIDIHTQAGLEWLYTEPVEGWRTILMRKP